MIAILCEKLGIEPRKKEPAAPEGKADIKRKIRELKSLKNEALAKKDYDSVILFRKKIRTYKRKLRKILKETAA